MNKHNKAFLYILLSSIGFGTLGIWGKLGYGLGFNPLMLLNVRFLLASVILWILTLATYGYKKSLVTRRELAIFAFQGGVLYAATAIGFFYSLQYLPASIAAILFYLHPIYTFLLSPLLFKEVISKESILALLIAVSGTIFLVINSGSSEGWTRLGLVYGLLAGSAYSLYTLSNQALPVKANSFIATTYTTSFCALVLLMIARPNYQAIRSMSVNMWLIGLGIATIGTVIGIAFYVAGVRLVGASEVSIYSAFEPLSGTLLAVLVLGEQLSAVQLIGVASVIFGATYLQWHRSQKRNRLLQQVN